MSRKLSSSKKREVFDKTDGHCAYCGINLAESIFSVDHIHPVINGGSNDIANLLACCLSCNASKGKRDIEDYRLYVSAKAVTGGIFFGIPQLKFLRDVGALDAMGVDQNHQFYFEQEQGGES